MKYLLMLIFLLVEIPIGSLTLLLLFIGKFLWDFEIPEYKELTYNYNFDASYWDNNYKETLIRWITFGEYKNSKSYLNEEDQDV